MTTTRAADARVGDLAVHQADDRQEVYVLDGRDAYARTGPGWVMRSLHHDGSTHAASDTILDGEHWTIVTLDQVRAMAAALRAGVPG